MGLQKENFVSYNTDENKVKQVMSVKLNESERLMIDDAKNILQNIKSGSVLKSLAKIGYESITKGESRQLLATVFKNKMNNKRNGIADFE